MNNKVISKKQLFIHFLKQNNVYEEYMSFFSKYSEIKWIQDRPIFRLVEDLKYINSNRYYYTSLYDMNEKWRRYLGKFLVQSNIIKKFLLKNKFMYVKLRLMCFIYNIKIKELCSAYEHCDLFFSPETNLKDNTRFVETYSYDEDFILFLDKVSTKWENYLRNLNEFEML